MVKQGVKLVYVLWIPFSELLLFLQETFFFLFGMQDQDFLSKYLNGVSID